MKLRYYLPAALLTLFIVWVIWSRSGRNYPPPPPYHQPAVTETVYLDTPCSRHVLAIQPWMEPTDYLSEEYFYNKINHYFLHAKQAGYLQPRTIVLLPEYLGTWLVLAGEKKSVASSRTINEAMATLIFSNFISFVRHWLLFTPEHTTKAALFKMKAAEMARTYTAVFRRLATAYKATIVAGSIVLPDPTVFKNEIAVHLTGELFNASFVFYPDGSVDPRAVKKSFLTAAEQGFSASCPAENIPVFDTEAGKTAVLICADSWFPESYQHVISKKAEIILVPSYAAGNRKMKQPWLGYDGQTAPADVNPADVGTLTEAQAWQKYALPGRMPDSATLGVNVFLRGSFWEMGSESLTLIVHQGKQVNIRQSDRDGLWRICF